MSDHDFILPAASQTLAVSRTNWNGSLNAVLQNYYGAALPAAADVNDEGTTGLVNGMLYRDSANGVVYVRDSGAFKGQTGHVTRNFTRVGIGTRICNNLVGASFLGFFEGGAPMGGIKYSGIEVGELVCTVGNSAGSANNRLYLKSANTAAGIVDVSIPPDGGIGVAKLNWDAPVQANVNFSVNNLYPSANNQYDLGSVLFDGANRKLAFRDLHLTRKIWCNTTLQIGGAGVSITGPTTSSGVYKAPNGVVGAPAYAFTNAATSGLFKSANSTQGTTSISTTIGGTQIVNANTRGIYPGTTATLDIGGLKDAWRSMHATNFYGQATTALYADLAERFEADEALEEGDVVMIGGEKEITKTDRESTPEVFGVISTQPAYAMNSEGGPNETHPYVALVGKVPVKVTGKVLKGQRLVASSQVGIAIAAETKNIFAVVGRALESSDELGTKLINAAVGKL